MRYEEIYTLIAWMQSPFENSGTWKAVSWWDQEMPEGMAEAMVEVYHPDVREGLIGLRDRLTEIPAQIEQLEEKWGKLPVGELRRHLDTDLFVLDYLNAPIGVEDSPLGTFSNLIELLNFVIEFDLSDEVW